MLVNRSKKLVVELDLVYTRRFSESHFRTVDVPPEPTIPISRALLFLGKRAGVWEPVIGGVKLIIDGEVYTYGQFMSNPGPLWLAKMAPENLRILPITYYGEELLLEDLQIAQEKAKSLRAPVRLRARDAGIVRDEYLPEVREVRGFALVVAILMAAGLGAIVYRRRMRRHSYQDRAMLEQDTEYGV